MEKDRFPNDIVVAVLFVCTGPVTMVEREGMYKEWFSISYIHCTPRWFGSGEDLGPPRFPMWQFR